MPADIKTEYYNSTKPTEKVERKWWTLPEAEQYQSVQAVHKNIMTKQSYRTVQNLRHARLYANLDILNLSTNIFATSSYDLELQNKLALNVVRSCIDTAASKIAKLRPRPIFLTEDGDWEMQNKAELLTKFIDGTFDDLNIYQKSQGMFIDACVFGTGFLKFHIDGKKVCCERVIPEEIVVDDAEGIYGKPRQLFQHKLVNRDTLIELFPEHAEEIRAAKSVVTTDLAVNEDFIKVIEAWKLPSTPEAKDGRHAITIDSCTLFSEDYQKHYFPFVSYRWSNKLTGYFGSGLAEELLLLQLEINKLLRSIQRAQHLMCVPRVFINQSSMINSQHISNEHGAVIKYKTEPPIFNTAPAMSAEVYQHLESLYRKAYEITGISMLSANARKPDGLNSGAALREYDDIESERFQLNSMRWEDVFLDAADIVIDLTKDLARKNPNLKVKLSSGRYAETIKWSDVKLEEDKYVMRKFPTSILPTQPAGKLQKVQELAQAGFIDKDTAYSLLDFPDLDAAKPLKVESMELTRKILGRMVSDGNYVAPEPYMDSGTAQTIAQQIYLKSKINDVPEERLELIRRFMEDCQSLKAQAQAAMMPAQPLAAPMPAQRSDLLPNAPGAAPGQGVAQMPEGQGV